MKPDKHKKKDYFRGSRSDYDDMIRKDPKIHQIKDDDELDELASRGSNNLVYRSKCTSNALDRLLRKHIGDKWDDVYSIVVNKIGHDGSIKWHVDLYAFEQDGKVVSIGYCGVQEVRGFYVLNGILGEQRKSIKYKRDTSKVKVTYVNGVVVFKHNDLYFKAPLDKSISAKEVWSNSSADYDRTEYYLFYTDRRKCKSHKGPKFAIPATHIRQLSSKEIMHWDLPNTEIRETLGLFFN